MPAQGKEEVKVTRKEQTLIHDERQKIQAILGKVMAAILAGDHEKAAREARNAGMKNPAKVILKNLGLLFRIPCGMKKKGFALHKDFDRFAELLEKEETTQGEALSFLSTNLMTERCSTCHSKYRLKVIA